MVDWRSGRAEYNTAEYHPKLQLGVRKKKIPKGLARVISPLQETVRNTLPLQLSLSLSL